MANSDIRLPSTGGVSYPTVDCMTHERNNKNINENCANGTGRYKKRLTSSLSDCSQTGMGRHTIFKSLCRHLWGILTFDNLELEWRSNDLRRKGKWPENNTTQIKFPLCCEGWSDVYANNTSGEAVEGWLEQ